MSDRIYCYPETDILKNIPGIRNKEKLLKTEIELTTYRMFELQQNPIKGKFDFDHLKKIHKHIFQDLYNWAGEPRTVNIGKGNMFCMVQYIDSYADSVFSKFAKDCIAAKSDHTSFVKALAEHYSDMNALHPFREGNGRNQREFARELCLYCGYSFDLSDTNHKEMLYASKLSFDMGDTSSLEAIFMKAVKPINNQQQLKKQLDKKIVTLSHDDVSTNGKTVQNNRHIPESEFPLFMQDAYTNTIPYDDNDSPSL